MKVVQFSKTPLAGAPIRIAGAVNSYTDIEVRHIDLKRWGIYEHDHVHRENPEETLALAEAADIIHLYNYVHLDSHDFSPVNFRELQRRGKQFLWHFESTPMLVSRETGLSLESILNSELPMLVIAQYPERFLKTAMVVPNIIPQNSPHYRPSNEPPSIDIVYSPTWTRGAWESRWDTKGMLETIKIMKRLEKNYNAQVHIFNQRPLSEVMIGKKSARIIIDELVTGSYHLSGLEGLSCAKPTLCFLDDRTEYVLHAISGSLSSPFINVRLEDSYEVIAHLLENKDQLGEIGEMSRKWLEQYWSDGVMVQHFEEIYELVLENPSLVTRQKSLRIDDQGKYFHAITLPDLIYNSRANHFRTNSINTSKIRLKLKTLIIKFQKWARKRLGPLLLG